MSSERKPRGDKGVGGGAGRGPHALSCPPPPLLAHRLATLSMLTFSLPQGCSHLLLRAPAGSLPGLRPARPSGESSQAPWTNALYSHLFIYSCVFMPRLSVH